MNPSPNNIESPGSRRVDLPVSGPSRLQFVLLAAVTASAGLAIDLCLPALPYMAQSLATDIGRVQQTLSVFILGVGLGQLFYGPVSDQYGRKPVLLTGFVLFTLSSLLCTLAQTVDQLIILRLLQAIGVACGAVVMRAVVRDLYYGEQAAKIFSQIMLVVLIAPLVAPLLAAQILLWLDWRYLFVLLGLVGIILLAGIAGRFSETLAVTEQRNVRWRSLPRQYGEVFKDRRTTGYFLCGSFTFAGMFAFVAGSPFVYIQYFGVPVEYFGFLYASNVLMISLLSWINSQVIVKIGLANMLAFATWLSMLAGSAVMVCAVTGVGGLWGIFPGLVIFIGTIGLIAANCNAGMLDPFGKSAGTASAILGAGRFIFGAAASTLVGFFHDGTPIPMAAIIFFCSVLAFLSYRYLVVLSGPVITAH